MSDFTDAILESLMYTFENQIFTGISPNPAPPAGGFWERTYPPDKPRPVVLIDVESDEDENVTPQRSVVGTIAIRCISEVSYTEARSFLIFIEKSFDGQVLLLNRWRSYNLERTGNILPSEEEREGGDWFYMVGDIYTISADKEGI